MAKGYRGESCVDAIRTSISESDILSFGELFRRVHSRGEWKDDNIWQSIMAVIVNLVPARYHWPGPQQFLFLRGDGQYELYDPQKHPLVVES
jgi:hypothetical protein